jgi:hypothetical protein
LKNQPGTAKLSPFSTISHRKMSSMALIPMLLMFAAAITTTTTVLIANPSPLSYQSAYAQTSFGTNTNSNFQATCIGCGQGVQLVNLHTIPSVVIVSNIFRIGATVINNSPHTITFIAGPCDSPLSATFDLQQHVPHVLVQHGPQCYAVAHLVKLQPGQSASVVGPSSGTTYKAIAAGQTTAIVTFHYYVTQYYSSSVSKSFVFTIRPSM